MGDGLRGDREEVQREGVLGTAGDGVLELEGVAIDASDGGG